MEQYEKLKETTITMRTDFISFAWILCGLTALASCEYLHPDKEIRSEEDLKGKIVGVEAGGYYDEELAGRRDFRVVRYKSTVEMLAALVRGEIDAFKDDEIAISSSDLSRNSVKIAFRDERTFDIGFAFRKNSQELATAFNEFLSEIRSNGQYQEIYDRWFNGSDPNAVPMPAIEKVTTGNALKIGVNVRIAPMCFQVDTEWRGFEIELLERFAAAQNRPCSITLFTLKEISKALENGTIDLWSGEIFITAERQQTYLFSDPYFACHPAWFVRSAK